jgi:predicted nucleic acid-binding protein
VRAVLDASALVEYLLSTPRSAALRSVVESADADLHIPALCDVEVASALRRLVVSRRLALERAREALTSQLELPLERHGHEAIVSRVLDLRDNFGAFDAVYVALAEITEARLVTADARLARAIRQHTHLTLVEA